MKPNEILSPPLKMEAKQKEGCPVLCILDTLGDKDLKTNPRVLRPKADTGRITNPCRSPYRIPQNILNICVFTQKQPTKRCQQSILKCENLVEELDRAETAMRALISRLQTNPVELFTEQDVRLQIINPVFTEVLGYPMDGIATEQKAGKKFLDYKLSLDGIGRLIVEAKRDDRSLGLEHRPSGRSFLINGSVFDTEAAIEGISQAITYCGRKNVELACVTNGREWIVFRGSRLGDGKDTDEGMAYVFADHQGVLNNFKLFYDLLSPEAVRLVRYRALLQEAEGQPIRPYVFNKPLRHTSTATLIDPGSMANDIDKVMLSFFRKLSGDDDAGLLRDCFVVTPESDIADKRLIRIAEDFIGKVKTLNTDSAQQLTVMIERALKSQRNEFILIVGLKGAGKSTFIDRFFQQIIPRRIADQCVTVRLDLSTASPSEKGITEWLDQQLVAAIENSVFGIGGPSDTEFQGMYYDEYSRRRKGTGKHLYQSNKTQFKIEFGKYLERRRNDQKHDYIKRMIRHIVSVRHKMPCIVFDNADHFSIEFQERVFQYARSIFETELCLMVVPITDKTSWHLSQQGALQSFDSETLFLPVPEPSKVIETRINYLSEKIIEEKREPGKGYFFSRGIELDIDNLNSFVASLQSIFIRSGPNSQIIEYLSNRDVRRCLDLARDIVSSGHLRVDQLLAAFLTGHAFEVDAKRVLRAIIKRRYDVYLGPQHKYVHNIYNLSSEIVSSPLLSLRILRMLRDMQEGKDDPSAAYIPVEQVLEYFRAMTIEVRAIQMQLSEMLKKGLIWSYDPTVTELIDAKRIEISPAGFQHLLFGLQDWVYMEAMTQVTPILEERVYQNLICLGAASMVYREARVAFVEYLIEEDRRYVFVPDHISYSSQKYLPFEIRRGSGA